MKHRLHYYYYLLLITTILVLFHHPTRQIIVKDVAKWIVVALAYSVLRLPGEPFIFHTSFYISGQIFAPQCEPFLDLHTHELENPFMTP